MTTWHDVASENYALAKEIERAGKLRGAINRYYYAAFHLLTGELIRRGATPPFGKTRWETPGHYEMPGLIDQYIGDLSKRRRDDLKLAFQLLRRRREMADYTLRIIDDTYVRETHRYVEQIIRYVGADL